MTSSAKGRSRSRLSCSPRNVDDILKDPEIQIVIELIGGLKAAKTVIRSAIENGKHVVTANKALLAHDGNELFGLARKKGLSIGFEASVGGGIPIIKSLREGLASNRINTIFGILNGTANYILTRMTEDKLSFADALKEAQTLGYAEADPTLDIEGIDTAHKLAIASAIAFGTPDSVRPGPYRGDIRDRSAGYSIRGGVRIPVEAACNRPKQGRPPGDAGPPDTHCAKTRACQREGRL